MHILQMPHLERFVKELSKPSVWKYEIYKTSLVSSPPSLLFFCTFDFNVAFQGIYVYL